MQAHLIIVAAASLLVGCASVRSPVPTPPSPLEVASCPDLTPLASDSFADVARKLQEVAGIYYECRAAVLGGQNDPR